MIPLLAVDPSLRATAWATIVTNDDGRDELRHDVLPPQPRDDPRRMLHIAGNIRQLAELHESRFVALEGASHNSTSSSADRIHGLHWMVRATLWGARIPYIIVPPATIKAYATGWGDAPKRTGPNHRGTVRVGMVDAARDDLGYDGTDDNIADAVWLHALVADALGQGYAPELGDPRARKRRAEAIANVVGVLPKEAVL